MDKTTRELTLECRQANIQILKNQEYLLRVPTVNSNTETSILLLETREILKAMGS